MANDFSLYREFSKTLGGAADEFTVHLVKSILKNLANAALYAVSLEHKLSAQIEELRAQDGYKQALAKATRRIPQTQADMLANERKFFAPMRTLKKARAANHKVAQPLVRAFKEANRYLSYRTIVKPKDLMTQAATNHYRFSLLMSFLADAMKAAQGADVDPMLSFKMGPAQFSLKTSPEDGESSRTFLWNDFLVKGSPNFKVSLIAVDYAQGLEAILKEALLALKEPRLSIRNAKAMSLQYEYEQLQQIRPTAAQSN